MSILTDLEKYRKYKCDICGSKETSYDKKRQKFKWYRTLVKGSSAFWCRKCYGRIYNQMKYNGNKDTD